MEEDKITMVVDEESSPMKKSSSSSTSPGEKRKLMFAPFSSMVAPSFWGKFDEVKVDVLKLDEGPAPLCGFYACHEMPDVNPVMSVDNTSFDSECKPYFGMVKVAGILKTTISSEHFKETDYNLTMRKFGLQFLQDLFTPEGLVRIGENPTTLASFFILLYADLKKYKFIFWFGFPAINLASFENYQVGPTLSAMEAFRDYDALQKELINSEVVMKQGFFFLQKLNESYKVVVKHIKELNQEIKEHLETVWFGFLDTSTVDGIPSWVLRNYLAFIKLKLDLSSESEINVFSYRPGRSNKIENDKSFTIRVLFQGVANVVDTIDNCKFLGWERNEKGAFGPKFLDAQKSMDPIRLAENSADFNLRLMKWRVFPEFDLQIMHRTKCLIIGAGTLGCNVARCLVGWGVRNITFVDNGNVSYSNPVRQSLYNFEDCLNGGKAKAEAAADSLKKILPCINAVGVKIMIPMPGHPFSASTVDEIKQGYETIDKLVQDCDVMFLLMDTRESRWLPTVLGAKYEKIVINAALGFDSYVVMRHGMTVGETTKRSLGCYFCTDVVAPGDSTKDRTLDQQCTVTRPGVSMIASALAVELMAAVLHHPERGLAPVATVDDGSSPLGLIPHSVRGFLSSGEQIAPTFQAYDKCTACSSNVLEALKTRGFDFVADVLNSSSDYLEKLTGLDQLKNLNEIEEGIIELSDNEDF